jgi:phosphohistidine phosphatase SixA
MRRTSERSSADEPRESDRAIVFVVRHACAGDKSVWRGDDDSQRPLDEGGIQQSEALAEALAGALLQRLLASPTKRCVDTLAPLAAQLGVDIETTERLAPDGSIESLLRDETLMSSGTVLCTHGELMKPLLQRLQSDGVEIDADRHDDDWLLAKGSAWRLVIDHHGHIVKLTHDAPLPLPDCGAHADSD